MFLSTCFCGGYVLLTFTIEKMIFLSSAIVRGIYGCKDTLLTIKDILRTPSYSIFQNLAATGGSKVYVLLIANTANRKRNISVLETNGIIHVGVAVVHVVVVGASTIAQILRRRPEVGTDS